MRNFQKVSSQYKSCVELTNYRLKNYFGEFVVTLSKLNLKLNIALGRRRCYLCMCVCVYTHPHTHTRRCCLCMCVCVHTNTHTHTHTHTLTFENFCPWSPPLLRLSAGKFEKACTSATCANICTQERQRESARARATHKQAFRERERAGERPANETLKPKP